MNDQPSVYDAVIADLRAKRDEIDALIQRLELFRNWVPPPMGGLAPEPSLLSQATASPPSSRQIAPGTFHGMGIQEAVKKLLLLRKRTMSAPELSADLRAGGLDFNPKSIASVLHRGFMSGGEIVRKDRGQWGLQEWYPNQRFKRGAED
jgi:hypothetical protein